MSATHTTARNSATYLRNSGPLMRCHPALSATGDAIPALLSFIRSPRRRARGRRGVQSQDFTASPRGQGLAARLVAPGSIAGTPGPVAFLPSIASSFDRLVGAREQLGKVDELIK